MAETLSLLEFIRELLFNDHTRHEFSKDPEGTLAEHGLTGLSPADVHDALLLVQDNQTADFSRDYNTGHNATASFTPPPPPVHHDGGHGSHGGHEDHKAAVEYLNTYITNNFIDDRDTITDNSINQQIDTGGGNFDQDIDIDSVVASGDGAVAAGRDIEGSNIVTGDGNQVGEGNVQGNGNILGNNNDGNFTGSGDGNVVGNGNQAVTGDGNTTSFGSGDASSVNVGRDLTVGDGSAFATGGTASVDNSDNSVNTDVDVDIRDSFQDNSDNSVNDSFNTEVDIDDSFQDNSDNSTNDSGNTDVRVEDITVN